MITAKVTGGDGKALKRFTAGGVARMKAANKKSADEFMALVKLAVPRDPEAKNGQLVDTVREDDTGPVRVEVSIGDAAHPYPAHLEFGHRSRGGTHVPAKPYWYPAKRVLKKRAHNRILRAERTAIKAAVAASTG